ncbi:MAG: YqeG family HAD IIIA-type phosphatase [Thermoguttaceae bacterium]
MFHLLTPDCRVKRVEELTLERLRSWGLRALLLDVDCTLTRYREPTVPAAVADWMKTLQAGGVSLCLVSNGLEPRIREFAARLDLPYVARAMKPLGRGVRAAMRKLDAKSAETAMVGDQLFADVLAGRMAGLRTILVEPIHPEEEPWFTRLKRPPERFFLRRWR